MARSLDLDVLRGIAILLVIGAHQHVGMPPPSLQWFAQGWHDRGPFGVPLFFALSGYLIGGLILDEIRTRGSFDLKRFLIRRGFKLYPAYYVFVAYLILMPTLKAAFAGNDPMNVFMSMLSALGPNFVFLQNYIGSNPAAHTWSLAVEEHFYLFLPVLILLLHRRRSLQWLPVIALASPAVFIAYRLIGTWLGDPHIQHLIATHVSLDGLALGVGLRSLKEYKPALFALLGRANWLWILAGICLVPIKNGVVPFPALAATMILLGTVHLRPTGRLAQAGRPVARLVGWIGLHSYSTYLWHVTFLGILRDKVLPLIEFDTTQFVGWTLYRVCICAGIILLSWMAARLVEWPMLKLRDRYFPSRSSPRPIAPPAPAPEPPAARTFAR